MQAHSGLKRLFKNSVLLMVLNLATRLSNPILFALLARRDKTAAGVFSLALSYSLLLEVISLGGLDQLLIRDVSHQRDAAPSLFPAFLGTRLLVCGVIGAGFLGFLELGTDYSVLTHSMILVMAVLVITEGFNDLVLALFIALDRLRSPVIIALGISTLRLLAVGGLILAGAQLLVMAGILVMISGIHALVNTLLLRRNGIPIWPHMRSGVLQKLAHTVLPLALINIFWMIDSQGGPVLVSIIYPEGDALGIAATYGTVTTVLALFTFLPQAFQMAVFPVLTRLYKSDQAGLRYWYERLYRLLALAGFGVVVLISAGAPLLIAIFGHAYVEAILVLQIAAWSLLFSYMTIPNTRMLILASRFWLLVLILGGSVIASQTLLLLLLPVWGVKALALARVFTLGVFFLLAHYCVNRLLWKLSLLRIFWQPAVASLAALLLVAWLGRYHWIIGVVAGGASYIGVLWLLGAIKPEIRTLTLLLRGSIRSDPQTTLEKL